MKIFNRNITKANTSKKGLNTNYWLNLSPLFNNDVVFSKQTFYDLYAKNGDIRECVKKISWSVARNGIYLLDNKQQIVPDNIVTMEVANLFKEPTFAKFKTNFWRNYLISWELYIEPIKNLMWQVIRFHVLDSRAVTKVIEAWVIKAFNVVQEDWTQRQYKADELWFFKYEDDINYSINGMWILTSVVYDAVMDLEAVKTNYSFYKNSARPDLMLLLDGNLTDEEQQIAKDQFEAQFKGSTNAHKVIVGGWIQDIKQLSLSSKDMEQIAQRELSTDKICSAFGVPKAMLWYIKETNYSNGQNVKEEYIEWTIKPHTEDFDDILNKLLQMFRPDLFKNYWIQSDSEQLKETQERYNGQRADVQCGILTINEARIDRWLEPLDDENANKPLVSRNAVLLEDVALDAVLPWDEI